MGMFVRSRPDTARWKATVPMQPPGRWRAIGSAVAAAAVIYCSVALAALAFGRGLGGAVLSWPIEAGALLGLVCGLVGVAVAGLLGAGVLVITRLARWSALVFLPAACVIASAAAALVWTAIAAAAPEVANGPDAGWLTAALGAATLLSPLSAAVAAGHVPAGHPWRTVTAMAFGTIALMAASPATSWVSLSGIGGVGASPAVALVLDATITVGAMTAVLVSGSLSRVPAGETTTVAGRYRWGAPLGAAAMALALVAVVVVRLPAMSHAPASAVALGRGVVFAGAGTDDDGLDEFVASALAFRETFETGSGCGDGSSGRDCLEVLMRECERKWPPNLAPETDATVARVVSELRAILDVYDSVRAGRREDAAAKVRDLDAALDELGQERRGPAARPACSSAAIGDDLSAGIGAGMAVVDRNGTASCRDGWALVAEDPSCPADCEGGTYVVRRIQGRWQAVTPLPPDVNSAGHCKESMAAEGAPDFVVEQVPPCPASGGGAGSQDPGYVVTERPDHTVEVNFSADVLFEFGSDELTPAARASLDQVAARLSTAKATVQIEGHTDSISTAEFNQQLSVRRAGAARDYLAAAGVTAEMQAVGYGLTRPIAPNTNPDGSDNPEGRSRNRRVTIVYQPGQ